MSSFHIFETFQTVEKKKLKTMNTLDKLLIVETEVVILIESNIVRQQYTAAKVFQTSFYP